MQSAQHERISLEIMKLETDLRRALSSTDRDEVTKFFNEVFSPDLIDIHGSGWIYSKKQSVELRANIAQQKRVPTIRSNTSEIKIVVLADDVVAVTSMNETYYEVPNPQDLAEKAGTLTMSSEARRHAASLAALENPSMWPGEAVAANPFRNRTTRIWKRNAVDDDGWKVVVSQTTRIGLRVNPAV